MNSQQLPTPEILRRRGVCVIIPTYNNATTIADVARESLHYCSNVIVVCDGCTDNTLQALKGIDGLVVLSYQRNKGKGYALKTGFRYARREGFSYAVTLDGDGQHSPADIPHLVAASMKHPGAFIIGARRDLDSKVRSKGSSFANSFANFWFSLQTGRRKLDTQSGFRLYPLRRIPPRFLVSNRYESELTLLVLPSWLGAHIHQTPIDVHYPDINKRVSHFRPGIDFARISLLNTLLTGSALCIGLPLTILRNIFKVLCNLYAILCTFLSLCVVITPLVKLRFAIGGNSPRNERWIHRTIRWGARYVMINHGLPGVKFSTSAPPIELHHGDNLTTFKQAPTPSIIICNHQSHFDLMCQLVFDPKVVFLTNRWVYHNPLYGSIVRHAEYLPAEEGIETLLPRMRDLVARGYSIAIYPEGTRSADCSIGRFHQGAFMIAQELGIGITPMYLYGAGYVLPKGGYSLHRHPIHIEIGAQISREQLDAMGTPRQQAQEMRRRYKLRYREIADMMERHV